MQLFYTENINEEISLTKEENRHLIKVLRKNVGDKINIINGKLHEGEGIFNNEKEIGKVLINNEYPFALIKFLDKNFDENIEFKTKEALIRIKKPDWMSK